MRNPIRNGKPRKVVQLVTGPGGNFDSMGGEIGHTIYALCDDGSMWELNPPNGWDLLPDVPQDALSRHWRRPRPHPMEE